eukprot:358578-Chlamydomonas_euryale.AAC.4
MEPAMSRPACRDRQEGRVVAVGGEALGGSCCEKSGGPQAGPAAGLGWYPRLVLHTRTRRFCGSVSTTPFSHPAGTFFLDGPPLSGNVCTCVWAIPSPPPPAPRCAYTFPLPLLASAPLARAFRELTRRGVAAPARAATSHAARLVTRGVGCLRATGPTIVPASRHQLSVACVRVRVHGPTPFVFCWHGTSLCNCVALKSGCGVVFAAIITASWDCARNFGMLQQDFVRRPATCFSHMSADLE